LVAIKKGKNMRKNCLVKLSGDAIQEKTIAWISQLAKSSYVVICVGGGTQINEAFTKAGFVVGIHGPLGRETKTLAERQLARDVLERNQAELQDRLADIGVQAAVVVPVIEVGTVLCHVNGDQFLLSAYHGFDELYVVTTPERDMKKKELFSSYPKIKVVSFPS